MDDARGHSPGASLLSQLEDVDLVLELEACGCRGELWVAVVVDFSDYSWVAFDRLVRAGSLTNRTHQRGRTITLNSEEWRELVRDDSLRWDLFREALEKHTVLFAERTTRGLGWVAGGRMSIRDYFFNGVLLQLANPVRGWKRRRRRERATALVPHDDLELAQCREPGLGPEEEFLVRESAQTIVAALEALDDEQLRTAILLRADTGRAWKDIAREVGLTPRVLESRRLSFRQSFDPS